MIMYPLRRAIGGRLQSSISTFGNYLCCITAESEELQPDYLPEWQIHRGHPAGNNKRAPTFLNVNLDLAYAERLNLLGIIFDVYPIARHGSLAQKNRRFGGLICQ